MNARNHVPGSPQCGGAGQQPCGAKPAIFKRAAVGSCPTGSVFDVGKWACFKCPSGYERSWAPIDDYKACQKKRAQPKLLGTFMSASKRGNVCPSGSFYDGIRGGECWKCPSGYGRTWAHVEAHNACQKDGVFGPVARAELVNRGTCNAGEIKDGIGGNGGSCWTCPEGTDRTIFAINSNKACEKSEWFDFKKAEKVSDLTCPAGEVFDFTGLTQYDLNVRPEFKGVSKPSTVQSGTCWACPEGYDRTMSGVKANDACRAAFMVWKPGVFKEPGLFGFAKPGTVEKVLMNIATRSPDLIASAAKAAAQEVARTNNKPEAELLSKEVKALKETPSASTVASAIVMRRIMTAISDPAKATNDEKELAKAFGKYIQERRTFMAKEALAAYEAWKLADEEERRKRNRNNMLSLIDYGTVPPEFGNVVAGTMLSDDANSVVASAAGYAAGAIPVVGVVLGDLVSVATGETLNAFGNFSSPDAIVRFGAKNAIEIALGKAVELFMQKMVESTARNAYFNVLAQQLIADVARETAIKTASQSSARLLSTLSGAGPTAIIAVQGMILSMSIDNFIKITEAKGRLNAALKYAEQPIGLSELARIAKTPEGIAELLTNWGYLTSADLKPGNVFMRDWVAAFQGVEDILSGKSTLGKSWKAVNGAATDIGAGPDGQIAVVNSKMEVFTYTESKKHWNKLNGALLHIDVRKDGMPVGINSEGKIYAFVNNDWRQLPGLASDVGVGANDDTWIIGTEKTNGGFEIMKWENNKFQKVGGGAMRIDVDPNGNPWVVNDKGQVYVNDNNRWQGFPQAPKAADISVGGNGAVYIAGVDGAVYGLNNGNWNKLPVTDKVVRLSVDQAGDVWAVTDRQKLFTFSR
ncbi:tectonin domain-containing protein [Terasakiella pusilla]|uniref:tectonin domain-containing protein n=1 Tax=Terasakiella pusilla TaxID=64973 RepID=UPI003AA7F3B9